jgi:hypothetical protein
MDQAGTLDTTLFTENIPWADSIARGLKRNLPRRSIFPYRAFAYFAVRGAVLMACRRKNDRAATHDPLNRQQVDGRASPDELLIQREERRNVTGPREYRQHRKLQAALALIRSQTAKLRIRDSLTCSIASSQKQH